MKREFKVGDKVRVIETGREAKIIRTGNAFDWRIKYKDGIEDLFCRDELKHLKPKLTEKRVREFKVGDKVIVNDERFTNKKGVIIKHDTTVHYPYLVRLRDGAVTWFSKSELQLIKPKHLKPKLTEKRIREIVREMIEEKMPYKWKVDLSILDEEMKRKYLNDAKPYINARTLFNCEPSKEQKPKSGWYKDTEHDEWMVFSNFENNSYFGINCSNEWVDEIAIGKIVLKDNEIPATNEEVISHLVDYIKSKEK
jgi:uncharacterized protein (UPF0216 family)